MRSFLNCPLGFDASKEPTSHVRILDYERNEVFDQDDTEPFVLKILSDT